MPFNILNIYAFSLVFRLSHIVARIKLKTLTTGSAPSYFQSLQQAYIPTRSLSVIERRLLVPSQRTTKSLSKTFSFGTILVERSAHPHLESTSGMSFFSFILTCILRTSCIIFAPWRWLAWFSPQLEVFLDKSVC